MWLGAAIAAKPAILVRLTYSPRPDLPHRLHPLASHLPCTGLGGGLPAAAGQWSQGAGARVPVLRRRHARQPGCGRRRRRGGRAVCMVSCAHTLILSAWSMHVAQRVRQARSSACMRHRCGRGEVRRPLWGGTVPEYADVSRSYIPWLFTTVVFVAAHALCPPLPKSPLQEPRHPCTLLQGLPGCCPTLNPGAAQLLP